METGRVAVRWIRTGLARGTLLGLIYPLLLAPIAAAASVGGPERPLDSAMLVIGFGVLVGTPVGAVAGSVIGLLAAGADCLSSRRWTPQQVAIGVVGMAAVAVGALITVSDWGASATSIAATCAVTVGGPAALGIASAIIAPLPGRRQLGPLRAPRTRLLFSTRPRPGRCRPLTG